MFTFRSTLFSDIINRSHVILPHPKSIIGTQLFQRYLVATVSAMLWNKNSIIKRRLACSSALIGSIKPKFLKKKTLLPALEHRSPRYVYTNLGDLPVHPFKSDYGRARSYYKRFVDSHAGQHRRFDVPETWKTWILVHRDVNVVKGDLSVEIGAPFWIVNSGFLRIEAVSFDGVSVWKRITRWSLIDGLNRNTVMANYLAQKLLETLYWEFRNIQKD